MCFNVGMPEYGPTPEPDYGDDDRRNPYAELGGPGFDSRAEMEIEAQRFQERRDRLFAAARDHVGVDAEVSEEDPDEREQDVETADTEEDIVGTDEEHTPEWKVREAERAAAEEGLRQARQASAAAHERREQEGKLTAQPPEDPELDPERPF